MKKDKTEKPVQLPAPIKRPRAFCRQPNREFVDVMDGTGKGTGGLSYHINDKGLQAIYDMAFAGVPLTTIAEQLGISHDAFAAIRKRQPEAEDAVRRGRSRVVGDMTRVLIKKALDGNTVELLFALKTLGGFREGVPVEGGTPAVAVNIQLVTPAAPGDVTKIIGNIPPHDDELPPRDDESGTGSSGTGGTFR